MKLLDHCRILAVLLLSASQVLSKAPAGPWDKFNYAPASRSIGAIAIHSTNGSIAGASRLVSQTGGSATFSGNGSYVVLDFGKEVRLLLIN